MTVATPIEAFLAYLAVERRMSAHTTDAYRRDLEALAQWSAAQAVDVLALQPEQLRAFVAAEHRRGLSPKSLQRRLSACRSFYGWHVRQGHLAASPAAAIRAPKAPRKLPQVLHPDEVKALVEVPTNVPLGLRDRALLELFYSSGLRLSELCALRWRDLDLADGLVTVLGKGSKQRSVPLGSFARNALQAWRASTRSNESPHCEQLQQSGERLGPLDDVSHRCRLQRMQGPEQRHPRWSDAAASLIHRVVECAVDVHR